MIFKKIFILTNFSPEVIEKILRVVRHRKFIIYSLHVKLKKKKILIYLTVIINNHSINLLISQLLKLIDIISINSK